MNFCFPTQGLEPDPAGNAKLGFGDVATDGETGTHALHN